MTCYHPITGYRTGCGEVIFHQNNKNIVEELTLPCGRCVGCRLERSRQWSIRCMHEASLYKDNCFVTLTYSDEHLPDGNSLHYPDFQKFMKRLRKKFGTAIRFYMCGEYGENLGRPHFHVCLFNCNFPDRKLFYVTAPGYRVYRSDILEELWPYGHSSIGALTLKSAAYVARYIMKKVNGRNADDHYKGRVPEFNRMSLKPGIGSAWFDKFNKDVYPHDYLVVNGGKTKPPRFYDKKYAELDPSGKEDVDFSRHLHHMEMSENNTPECLAIREEVQLNKFFMILVF